MAENDSIAAAYLEEARRSFRGYKRLAEDALAQLADQEFFHLPDPESNSAAIIVKHIAGNLRSRWSDFLTTDGEKPDRDRDQEFVLSADSAREELMRRWEEGWNIAFNTLQDLKPEDLSHTVYIRRQPHTVLQAINRSLAHCAYHVGQILYLGKHLRGAEWKSLSVTQRKISRIQRDETRRVESQVADERVKSRT